ncbi:MAG: hypothetical protein ACXV3A_07225 [Kineosporiaceae bacterium]
MGLFGRARVTRTVPVVTGPVPGSPEDRVAAVKAELVEHAIGGASAQGRTLTRDHEFRYVVATIEHFLPDAAERRALCRQMAEDLRSMILVAGVDPDEIEDVLGVTPARLGANRVPRREWAASQALVDTTGLVREIALGEGLQLDRWRQDDSAVTRALAVLFVVFTRLAV